ncbi:MAG: oxygen-dependent coproporphyrinogen oxidase [Cytophagaceae bacterium]|jgi:coproporphyrinogen III oxidase|nr:oxygen-dependent coproporphyrinogen oxidase [Cytophagaceae bacterium]
MITRDTIENSFKDIQQHICIALEQADGKATFQSDHWKREGGGGGITKIMQEGNIIAKGGVNFSAVYGPTPSSILKALGLEPADFYATGVSIVMHPINPWVPIIHMNIRYFEMTSGVWWFGGGIDLTPHYIDAKQAHYFHTEVKKVCDAYHSSFYPCFKPWADQYFHIPHRKETRGIGGIFFDRLGKDAAISKERLLAFTLEIGKLMARVYPQLMEWNSTLPYTESELRWQRLRRGRYVEFNLVYDKGTKFGLDTNGRTESILMSLPPLAAWEYEAPVAEGSPEQQTLEWLQQNPDWLTL